MSVHFLCEQKVAMDRQDSDQKMKDVGALECAMKALDSSPKKHRLHLDIEKIPSPPPDLSLDMTEKLFLNSPNAVSPSDHQGQFFYETMGCNSITAKALSKYFKDQEIVIVDRIGKGHFATIFRIRKKGEDLALKLNHFAGLGVYTVYDPYRGDPLPLQMNHDHILSPRSALYLHEGKVVEQGKKTDLLLGIIMPLVENGDLETLLQKNNGVLPCHEVIRLGAQIASAVAFLHSLNILHRDLKPNNILLDEKGNVKLSDFGLSKRIHFPTKSPVNQNCYAAPERILLENGYSFPSDAWSLGIILYKMSVGEFPYKSTHDIANPRPFAFPESHKVLKEVVFGLLTADTQKRMTAHVASECLSKLALG